MILGFVRTRILCENKNCERSKEEAGWVLLGGKIKALPSPNRTSAPSKDQKKRWTKLKKLGGGLACCKYGGDRRDGK